MSEQSPLQIVIYDVIQARAALRVAVECGVHVTLVSSQGAAGFAGPLWFREVIDQASAAVPEASYGSVLDCAGSAGDAMAAIHAGVPAIAITGPPAVERKITDMAVQAGCEIVRIDYSSALDLADCDDPDAVCRSWLGD